MESSKQLVNRVPISLCTSFVSVDFEKNMPDSCAAFGCTNRRSTTSFSCNIDEKYLCWSLFLNNLQTFRLLDLNFIKKRPQHSCFPVNIARFSKLPILKNICKRFLFNFFNGSLLHGLYDGVRLQGPSHNISLVFVFKSASLALKQIPTCIRKPKTSSFDK